MEIEEENSRKTRSLETRMFRKINNSSESLVYNGKCFVPVAIAFSSFGLDEDILQRIDQEILRELQITGEEYEKSQFYLCCYHKSSPKDHQGTPAFEFKFDGITHSFTIPSPNLFNFFKLSVSSSERVVNAPKLSHPDEKGQNQRFLPEDKVQEAYTENDPVLWPTQDPVCYSNMRCERCSKWRKRCTREWPACKNCAGRTPGCKYPEGAEPTVHPPPPPLTRKPQKKGPVVKTEPLDDAENAEHYMTVPCNACRQKRQGCSRESSGCSRCVRAGTPCVYSEEAVECSEQPLRTATSGGGQGSGPPQGKGKQYMSTNCLRCKKNRQRCSREVPSCTACLNFKGEPRANALECLYPPHAQRTTDPNYKRAKTPLLQRGSAASSRKMPKGVKPKGVSKFSTSSCDHCLEYNKPCGRELPACQNCQRWPSIPCVYPPEYHLTTNNKQCKQERLALAKERKKSWLWDFALGLSPMNVLASSGLFGSELSNLMPQASVMKGHIQEIAKTGGVKRKVDVDVSSKSGSASKRMMAEFAEEKEAEGFVLVEGLPVLLLGKGQLENLDSKMLSKLETNLSEYMGLVRSTAKKKKGEEREQGKKFLCHVCATFAPTVLLLPCKHMCVCENCSGDITSTEDPSKKICPLCRAYIEQAITGFQVSDRTLNV